MLGTIIPICTLEVKEGLVIEHLFKMESTLDFSIGISSIRVPTGSESETSNTLMPSFTLEKEQEQAIEPLFKMESIVSFNYGSLSLKDLT
jgi:hypothetical protein